MLLLICFVFDISKSIEDSEKKKNKKDNITT